MPEIEKKKISEIIDNYVKYLDKKRKHYLTIMELNNIIHEIISSNKTTKSIRITPFYENAKLRMAEEIEEFTFFIECREEVSQAEKTESYNTCFIKKYYELNEVEKERNDVTFKKYNELNKVEQIKAEILRPLIKYDAVEMFQDALKKYYDFLVSDYIFEMTNDIKNRFSVKESDLVFGYFCFEINCN